MKSIKLVKTRTGKFALWEEGGVMDNHTFIRVITDNHFKPVRAFYINLKPKRIKQALVEIKEGYHIFEVVEDNDEKIYMAYKVVNIVENDKDVFANVKLLAKTIYYRYDNIDSWLIKSEDPEINKKIEKVFDIIYYYKDKYNCKLPYYAFKESAAKKAIKKLGSRFLVGVIHTCNSLYDNDYSKSLYSINANRYVLYSKTEYNLSESYEIVVLDLMKPFHVKYVTKREDSFINFGFHYCGYLFDYDYDWNPVDIKNILEYFKPVKAENPYDAAINYILQNKEVLEDIMDIKLNPTIKDFEEYKPYFRINVEEDDDNIRVYQKFSYYNRLNDWSEVYKETYWKKDEEMVYLKTKLIDIPLKKILNKQNAINYMFSVLVGG